jgi:lipopolysaccharide transport system permease protein
MNRETRHLIDMILVFIEKDLKVRYKSTFFGYLWSIGHPLIFAVVYYIAFKLVIRIQVESYALFLISGLFPWQWFSNSLNAASGVYLSNWTIIKKINFPRELLVFAVVLQDMIHFLLSLPVIILFLFIYGKGPSLSWIYGIPLLLFIQFLLTYGAALFISSVNLFFRDLERLTAICLILLFYVTPIIYPETMIPSHLKGLLSFNPIAHLMVSWQNLLVYGTIVPVSVGISLAYALAVFFIGYLVYRRLSWRFAEVL